MTHHPLGVGADPTKNHHTGPNRAALAGYLALYWTSSVTEKINTRRDGDAKTGMRLADRFVSLLEIGHALKRLSDERADLLLPLELVYREDWTREKAAQRLRMDRKTLAQRLDEGLNLLIDIIWRDGEPC